MKNLSEYASATWKLTTNVLRDWCVSSSSRSAAYIGRWTESSLVQVMACRLFRAKPLPEPMLVYCQLDPWEHVSWNLNRSLIIFIQENCI